MLIPRSWTSAFGECKHPDGSKFSVSVWGWGDDETGARNKAEEKLQRLLNRVRKGEPFPDQYDYGAFPVREEILQVHEDSNGQALAVITRNRYGARVLNVDRVLFLDIDLPPQGLIQKLKSLFSGMPPDDKAMESIKAALKQHGRGSFRIYRTAAGYRVIAVDREYDPKSSEAQALMQNTGTDPAFSRLCKTQQSFRARLTPKPWRCGLPLPPGKYPRPEKAQHGFSTWLAKYEANCTKYATCRYLETIGSSDTLDSIKDIIDIHDRETKCMDSGPLA